MSRVSEQISKSNATSQGRTDANLANDALHLGGIEANDYATKEYVQEYHNVKESILKQYIDKQDASVLNEAKEYTNSQIRNQDFSNFAEISDLQALNTNLTSQITEGLNAQKQYTDQITNQIVSDTNANFKDVEDAIGSLNNNVNSLFQSVSNGKSAIAEAITDKGVPTSANDSYSTMAGNIRAIPTGGGSGTDPNYVNTSDADAIPEDIKVGKTAYAKGQKIIGTYIPDNTPIVGIDTSDATATSGDIMYGKTAYAKGIKLVGTLLQGDIEEIYGLSIDAIAPKYLTENKTDLDTQNPITEELIAYSKDLTYVVRLVHIGDDTSTKYIESFSINDDGYSIIENVGGSGSATILKYRYTMEELGIPADETISSIAFGARGIDGSQNKCRLFISTVKKVESNYVCMVYAYTYNLHNNGEIKTETIKSFEILNEQRSGLDTYLVTPNLDMNRFVVLTTGGKYNGSAYIISCKCMPVTGDVGEIVSKVTKKIDLSDAYYSVTFSSKLSANYKFTTNDKYIVYCGAQLSTVNYCMYIEFDSQYNVVNSHVRDMTYMYNNIVGTDLFITYSTNTTNSLHDIQIASFASTSVNTIKTIKTNSSYWTIGYALATNDVVILFRKSTSGVYGIEIYNIDITTVEDGATITPDAIITTSAYWSVKDFTNNLTTIFYRDINGKLLKLNMTEDMQNVIGVRYKDKVFYRLDYNSLTATQADVVAGKTFIGNNGMLETGTLEV